MQVKSSTLQLPLSSVSSVAPKQTVGAPLKTEAFSVDLNAKEVREDTANVHKAPNPLPAQIAETGRVIVASALKLRLGQDSVDTTIRFGARRDPLPLFRSRIALTYRQEDNATVINIERSQSPFSRFSIFPSPNFRLPGTQIDLKV